MGGKERGIKFRRVNYDKLNGRQKENYNFQKVSGILADYGFATLRLSDDWQGADFIAQHVDGKTFLKIQLKTRLTFGKKYQDKDIFIVFQHTDSWYLFPHDELLKQVLEKTNVGNTKSWKKKGGYSFPKISTEMEALLCPYKIK